MAAWGWAVAAVASLLLLCLAMWAFHTVRARRIERHIDDMVCVFGPKPGCDCDDCDDMREHMRTRPDCAEACCWQLRMDELVAAFDWDAAEDDLLRRRQ